MKNKSFKVIATVAFLLVGILGFLKFTGADLLTQMANGGMPLLLLVTISALLDSINPCAFSILLLTIAFLFSMGELKKKVLVIGSMYIAGVFAVYVLIGLGILRTLSFFNIPGFMGKIGASLIIVLGILDLVNTYFPAFPIKLKIPTGSHKTMAILMEKSSVPAAFLLGVFVGLCEFPCTGGPYLLILGLLHDTRTYIVGLEYLLYYNLIFILPLIVILLISSNPLLLQKVQAWKSSSTGDMRFASGILMILLGVIIFLL
ncbi:MAG: cytochrome c biogenesis protein CcdA [Candidatus Paceibacterota bacterium]|jgi:cytochrome c biogenesis protein CcdA